jgi:hypothetical protein
VEKNGSRSDKVEVSTGVDSESLTNAARSTKASQTTAAKNSKVSVQRVAKHLKVHVLYNQGLPAKRVEAARKALESALDLNDDHIQFLPSPFWSASTPASPTS